MKRLAMNGFKSAIGVLLLATSGSLIACGNGSGAKVPADDDSQPTAGVGGSSAENAGEAGAPAQGGQADDGKGNGKPLPINAGEYTEASFNYKDTHPADFNPLNDKESTLLKRDETAIAYGAAALTGVTLDDAGKAFTQRSESLAPELAGLKPLEMVSANLDDDGADEVAALGTNGTSLVLRIIDSTGDTLFSGHQDLVLADKAFSAAHLRAADVDGDGRSELLVSASNGTTGWARVFDDSTQQLALLKELKAGSTKEVAIAIGNFDADLAPELALLSDEASGIVLQTFDDAAAKFAGLRTLDKTQLPLPQALKPRGLRLEAGNFDSDATDELAVLADGYDTKDPQNWVEGLFAGVLQDSGDDAEPIAFPHRQLPAPHMANNDYRLQGNSGWQTQVADLNGDGRDELVVVERAPNDDGNNFDFNAYRFAFDPDHSKWQDQEQLASLAKGVKYNASVGTVTVGQTDGLGRDVLVTLENDYGQTPLLETHRIFASGARSVSGETADPNAALISSQTRLEKSLPAGGALSTLVPVSGDFDGDSLRVRFTGKKWLELTRPRPMVVLAAPPAKDGISQVTDNSSTSYGTSKSIEKATTEEYSITRKVTLSFELPIPGLDFLNVGASASMSQSMSQSNTVSLEETYGSEYATSYPDNVVVFNGVLCMRYEYQVLGGADTGLIGSLMTIDVPLDSRIYKWTTSYYNESLGDRGSPIDEKILPQTAGDPSTFPSVKQRDALMGAAKSASPGSTVTWKSDAMSVGQGTGANSVSIDLNSTTTTETSFTTSTEFGAKAGAFVSAEYSQGTDETAAYSVTVTRGTEFQGSVGDIEKGSDYADWFFSYGLFVYPATLAKGEKVQVVNYWTEGFGPGYGKP